MVPDALRGRAQWLVWRLVWKSGTKKQAKMPFYASGRVRGKLRDAPVQIEQGSEEDRALLTTFDYAMTAMSRGRYDGVGFAFLPGDGLIGIDIDDAIDVDTGVMSDRAKTILNACQSFAELSPSRNGIHIYARGNIETFKSNDIGVEVFCGSQFFAVTGEQIPNTPGQVNDLPSAALDLLRQMVNDAKESARQKRMAEREERERAASETTTTSPPLASSEAGRPASRPTGVVTSIENDFTRVNAAAMQNLDAWVSALFPGAMRSGQGFRVSSKSLKRDLQEDLSIHRDGIVDFGLADMGDDREGRRTPIDLVIEWGGKGSPKDALHWLAERLGVQIRKPGSGRPRGDGAKASQEGAPAGHGAPPDDGPPAGGVPPDDGPPLEGMPVIQWRNGFLPQIVDEAEDALLGLDAFRLFQRSGMLVRVVRKEVFSSRSYKRPPGVLGTVMVEAPHLTELMTRAARWEKFDSRSEKWVRTNAPEKVATTYLSRAWSWRLPILWSTIAAPTLRPDGSILQEPGYDAAMRTFYDPGEECFPPVAEKPTRDEARRALDVLAKAISTFPFEETVDRSVALAAMLTALVRRSLPSAPLIVVTAPSPESGKTLLCDFISILAMGTMAPAMKYAENDEEAVKVAMSVLLEGDPVVMIDNIERPLQGDWLCSMLTSEIYKGRILGRSEMGNLATNCLWLANGNKVIVAGDLRHRALLCRLDAAMERPGERVFQHDLRVWASEHRATLVSAGLTVMRAFVAAGVKPRDCCAPWGRFEQWTDLVRAPLMWLGEQDPCASLSVLEAEDPARQEHLSLLSAWAERFGERQLTAREVIAELTPSGIDPAEPTSHFRELVREIADDRQGIMRPKRLASWLRKYAGRRVEGLQLVKAGDRDHTAVWMVKQVTDE